MLMGELFVWNCFEFMLLIAGSRNGDSNLVGAAPASSKGWGPVGIGLSRLTLNLRGAGWMCSIKVDFDE